jgi:streptogramin lyase
MSIQTNGMIGIGTTYSAERLRVQGQAFFKNDHLVYGSLIISSNLTISSCNIIPMVTSAPHVTNNTTFTTYLSRCISTTSGAWWASATNPIYTSISMTKVSSETHSGGLLLPGGRVLFVPYTSNKLRIFDPKTNTVTTMDIPSGSALYSGAVLLKNGLVILAPYNNYIGFFNPINNIYTSTQYAQFNSADFRGAVLGNDGYVYFMPFNSIYSIGLYNPTNNLFGVITTTALPLNAYYGGVSLPDGRIIGVPHSATNVLIINTTGSYSLVGTTPGNQAYAGGVLLPDGRVLFVPYNRSTIGFFDPSTNSYTELSITVTTGSAPYFRGGVLTADNRVILSPYNSYNIGVYNITTNTYSEITTGLTSVNTFGANVMLLDGRVLFVPYSTGVTSAPIGIVSGFPKLPSELCFHPAFNKI